MEKKGTVGITICTLIFLYLQIIVLHYVHIHITVYHSDNCVFNNIEK